MLSIARSTGAIRRFLTYDLEWYPGSYLLRVVGVFDGYTYRYYRTIREFLQCELTYKNAGCWFYAHFGGTSDMAFLFGELLKDDRYRIHACFTASSANIVRVQRGRHKWMFIDSAWLMRTSLKNIGEFIGNFKGECAFDAPLPELLEYNEQDCRVLWQAIAQFEQVLLGMGGQLQMTVASSALHLFRARYLSRDIPTSKSLNDISRKSYVASRVEVFRPNCDRAHYYDINSSFPYAMTFPVPGKYLGLRTAPPAAKENLIWFARCRVTVPNACEYPPLPVRIGKDGQIFFPVGTWDAYYTDVDLEVLESAGGTIEHIYDVHVFEPCHDFAAYANDLYALRKKGGTKFESQVYKILLNSLYGKLAEGEDKQAIVINPRDTMHRDPATLIMPGVWRENTTKEVDHAHVPISAHITSIARRTLFRRISAAKGRVYYCDTDSVIVDDADMPTGKALGEWDKEYTIERGRFLVPKMYAIKPEGKDWQIRAKGFQRPADGPLDYDTFVRLSEKEPVRIVRMARIREMLRDNKLDPHDIEMQKRIRMARIPKRAPSGENETRPWTYAELKQHFEK